ncbi:hypothetical protein QWY86_04850 [Pedobacter aquatilis]|uniref:hypothetical protein n=1 Tax=Pedobacter aquatilis TaxID=351343 RepID=UPI0025B301CF|nr:hypothetical protein [Pedobacter aquatilis]MDN3585983.1 hypothetical protein [Pedobacter aquatilis]
MENFNLAIKHRSLERKFQVSEYMHHIDDKCNICIFENENFVAGFVTGRYGVLEVCKNPGKLSKKMLEGIADLLERDLHFGSAKLFCDYE